VRNFYGVIFRHGIMTGMLLASFPAQAEWLLHDSATACVLETDEITRHDGYQDTSVRLNINQQRLLVMTGSTVPMWIPVLMILHYRLTAMQ